MLDFAKLLGANRLETKESDKRVSEFLASYGRLDESPQGATGGYMRERSAQLRQLVSLVRLLQLVDAKNPRGLVGLREAKGAPKDGDKPTLIAWAQDQIGRGVGSVPRKIRTGGTSAASFALVPDAESRLEEIRGIVADWIVRGERVEICDYDLCRAPFFVTDERMKYCTRACRIRGQHMERQQAIDAGRKRRTRR